jgi:hypothetical protein
MRCEIARAQLRYQEYADNHRLPAPNFHVGDHVWLDAQNWKTKRPAHKLDNKRHGPFGISEVISPYAYCLELSEGMRIHPVFHVSLLESAANDPYPGQRQRPPPPVEIDGEPEWYANAILDSRIYGRQQELQYLVKWTGYDQPKWEPATIVKGLEVIDRFHEQYPDKPGPGPRTPKRMPSHGDPEISSKMGMAVVALWMRSSSLKISTPRHSAPLSPQSMRFRATPQPQRYATPLFKRPLLPAI